ncbi:histidine kinase [Parapedomonas caeni]
MRGWMLPAAGVLVVGVAAAAWWLVPDDAADAPARPTDAQRDVAARVVPASFHPEAPRANERAPLSDAEREARRLRRYDKDRDGQVDRAEFLASRRKAFGKLDQDGDGRLSFEEYAIATATKFTGADVNGDNRLSAAEFATTAVKRAGSATRRTDCPPAVETAREE